MKKVEYMSSSAIYRFHSSISEHCPDTADVYNLNSEMVHQVCS